MAKRTPKHGTRKTLIGSISVFMVIIFAGFLLVTNMRVNRTTTVSSDAAELVENRVKQADRLQQEVNELSAQVGALSAQEDSRKSTASENAGSSTMLPAVEGPGITVTLKDSSMWQSVADTAGSSVDWDKYVVHQQDVEAVVNALRYGPGAPNRWR